MLMSSTLSIFRLVCGMKSRLVHFVCDELLCHLPGAMVNVACLICACYVCEFVITLNMHGSYALLHTGMDTHEAVAAVLSA